MSPGRGGQWSTGGGRSRGHFKAGPTNDEEEVKGALQRYLKPAHYPIIVPWMANARVSDIQDVIVLIRALDASEAELANQRTGYMAATEPLMMNRNGRARVAKAIPVTADRLQADLLRNRHGSEQRSTALEAKRNFFCHQFAKIPSTGTVDDAHRLGEVNLMTDSTTRVLTEEARRKLHRWQVRGPERDRSKAAQVMRALRCISEAVTALPTYNDHCRSRDIGGGAGPRMHEYSQLVGKGNKTFKEGMVPGQLRVSRSAPVLMRVLRPYISQEDIDKIQKPGGDVVTMTDVVQLQTLKNGARASRSKIAMAGGKQEYGTTYRHMTEQPRIA